MLEFTYYNTEKIANLKDFSTVSFVLIDDVYNELNPESIKIEEIFLNLSSQTQK